MRIFLYVGWKFIFNMGNRHPCNFHPQFLRRTHIFCVKQKCYTQLFRTCFSVIMGGVILFMSFFFRHTNWHFDLQIPICLCTLRFFIGFYKYRMANDKQRSDVVTSPCRMAIGQLRSSVVIIAPHRAETQWSPQGEIAAREGVGECTATPSRASKMSDNNAPTYRAENSPDITCFVILNGVISDDWFVYAGMILSDIFDALFCVHTDNPTPSRNAISPCGLHCVSARWGATIAALLRSLTIAIRQGEDTTLLQCLFCNVIMTVGAFLMIV